MSSLVKARALGDVDVKLLSLVKRGANGEPFAITKSDTPKELTMLDISSHFSRLKKSDKAAPATSAVAYVAVSKSADLDATKDRLKDTGLNFDNAQEVDGGTIFKQDDAELDTSSVAIIQVSEDVTLGITGVKKEFSTFAFESEVFADVMAQEGVFPSLRIAEDALHVTIMNILYNDPQGPAEAAKSVGKACNDFKNYVVGMIGGLPEQVFKADEAMGGNPDTPDVEEIVQEVEETEDVEKSMGMGDKKKKKKTPAKKEEAAEETVAETVTDETPEVEEVEVEEVEKTTETTTSDAAETPEVEEPKPQDNAILKAVADLGQTVSKGLADLDGKIDVVNQRVDTTIQKMDGTVLGAIDTDDEIAETPNQVKKSADDISLIDTALRG
mgnify:CR=1 FL=1